MSQVNNVINPEEWAEHLAERDRVKAKENNSRLQSGGNGGNSGGMEARVIKLEEDVKSLGGKQDAIMSALGEIKAQLSHAVTKDDIKVVELGLEKLKGSHETAVAQAVGLHNTTSAKIEGVHNAIMAELKSKVNWQGLLMAALAIIAAPAIPSVVSWAVKLFQ